MIAIASFVLFDNKAVCVCLVPVSLYDYILVYFCNVLCAAIHRNIKKQKHIIVVAAAAAVVFVVVVVVVVVGSGSGKY